MDPLSEVALYLITRERKLSYNEVEEVVSDDEGEESYNEGEEDEAPRGRIEMRPLPGTSGRILYTHTRTRTRTHTHTHAHAHTHTLPGQLPTEAVTRERKTRRRVVDARCVPCRAPESEFFRKVNIRLHGKGNSEVPWRKAVQPRHLVDVVDSDQ